MQDVDWSTLIIVAVVGLGILLGPFRLLRLVQMRWEQQRRERIARGEDVTPRRIPDDEYDD